MLGLVPMNRRKNDLLMSDFNNFDNMLDDFFDDRWWKKRGIIAETFRMEGQEKENDYFVEAELPGVKKEEIVKNYTLSTSNLNPIIDRFSYENDESLKDFLGAEAEHIIKFLDFTLIEKLLSLFAESEVARI